MPVAYASNATNTEEAPTGIIELFNIFLEKLPFWAAAAVVLILTFIVAKIASTIVRSKISSKIVDDEEHQEFEILGARMTYIAVLIVGITIALKIAGIDLTSVIAAGALGIGFALKDLIINFLAGVMILVNRQFSIGDFIKVNETIGKVEEIQSRVTVLQAIDGTRVIVPNSDLFLKEVTSFTSNPFRRIEVIVGVDYSTNLEQASQIAMQTMKSTPGILAQPEPHVIISDFGDSSITLKIRAWVDSKGGWIKIKSDLTLNIRKAFKQYGINIPFPIRTLVQSKDEPGRKNRLPSSPVAVSPPSAA
jgi:small conductance mechanosensitive channel